MRIRKRTTSPSPGEDDVRRLQRLINKDREDAGLPPLPVDGKYGPATHAALGEFIAARSGEDQKKEGHSVEAMAEFHRKMEPSMAHGDSYRPGNWKAANASLSEALHTPAISGFTVLPSALVREIGDQEEALGIAQRPTVIPASPARAPAPSA